MKLKRFSIAIILYLFFAFSGNGFAEEESSVNKSHEASESSETANQKPDISMEIFIPKQDGEKGIGEKFEDDDFGEVKNGKIIEETEEEISDPMEPFNRMMWTFNENLYDYALDPLARGYKKVFPVEFRRIVRNFFSNIASPITLISSALQNNKDKVDRTLGRFLINSTLGVGGLFDPASSVFKIKKVNEDFDQALGYYNVPPGPFVMLPLLGPTTLRGITGKIPQMFLGPEFIFGIDFLPAIGARGTETVNEVSFNLDKKEELDDFAIDPYTSLKHFYIQRRKALVNE